MRKTSERVLDSNRKHSVYADSAFYQQKQKTLDTAKLLISIAIYLITAGTLMDYVSIPVMLKTIGFMLTGQAFYFLWKSHTNSSSY